MVVMVILLLINRVVRWLSSCVRDRQRLPWPW
jgi:hypothetical protein